MPKRDEYAMVEALGRMAMTGGYADSTPHASSAEDYN